MSTMTTSSTLSSYLLFNQDPEAFFQVTEETDESSSKSFNSCGLSILADSKPRHQCYRDEVFLRYNSARRKSEAFVHIFVCGRTNLTFYGASRDELG